MLSYLERKMMRSPTKREQAIGGFRQGLTNGFAPGVGRILAYVLLAALVLAGLAALLM